MYYILGYNQLSNSCSMATDELVHVRAYSTASTRAFTVPELLSLLRNYQKVPMGGHASNPRSIRGCLHASGCTLLIHYKQRVFFLNESLPLNIDSYPSPVSSKDLQPFSLLWIFSQFKERMRDARRVNFHVLSAKNGMAKWAVGKSGKYRKSWASFGLVIYKIFS